MALFFRDVSCWPTPAPTYRGDECGYHGPAVADEYDQPTSDITKDKCSKCLSGCKFRNNVGNFGGFLPINKLSQ